MILIKTLIKKLDKLIEQSIYSHKIQSVLYNYYVNNPADFKQTNSRTGRLRPKTFKNLELKLIKCFNKFNTLSYKTKGNRLKKLNIHPRLLLSPPIVQHTKKHFSVLWAEIFALREEILYTSNKIIENMVNSKSMYSLYIDRQDIEQWAWEKAWEATLQYDPKRGSWDTYLVYTLSRSLYKEIAENSRLINLPRWVLSRWSPISRALKENPDNVVPLANKKANSSIAKKKKYTEKEINYLNNIVNASFENVFTASNNLSVEPKIQIDIGMLRSNIMEEAKKLLTKDELTCLEHKLDGVKRAEIFNIMKKDNSEFTVSQLNKCHVQIMKKLKDSERLKQLMEFIKEEE